MISADVKANKIRRNKGSDGRILQSYLTIFYKKFLQNLKYNVNRA